MTTPCLKQLDADCFRTHPAWAKRAFAYRLVHLLTPKPLTKRLPKALRLALIAPGVELPPGVEFPPGVVVSPGADLPTTWSPGDPVPSGVTIQPGAVFPAGWTAGDPLPDGVTLDPGVSFPPGWSPGDPIPPGVTIQPGAVFPAGWTAGDPLPDGVVLDPGAEIPAGWQPPDPLPSGALPVPVMPPDAQASGPIPPTYTAAWGPGPVTRPAPSPTGVAWELRFAPPHFSGGYKMTWTGTDWRIGPLSSPATAGLEAQSPPIWQEDYRPTHIRITYTGNPITNFNIRDQGWHKIITPQNQPLASLQAAAFDWTYNQDIHTLHMFIAAGQTNISAIEFLPA